MKVCWFSGGISSFIAGYLEKDSIDEFIYTHIDNQHPDTLRFIKDCEKVLGKPITILQSPYKSVDNVIETFRSINTAKWAKCTEILKKRVRKEWEHGKKDLAYVWGFDCTEQGRAESVVMAMPKQNHIFPLIENSLIKEDCHGIVRKLGIKRPAMYNLGYHNNNCIGCVKGGMGYWNKIRVDFPDVFARRARQEREIGRTCIKGVYLDELDPTAGRMNDEILTECGIMCQIYSA